MLLESNTTCPCPEHAYATPRGDYRTCLKDSRWPRSFSGHCTLWRAASTLAYPLRSRALNRRRLSSLIASCLPTIPCAQPFQVSGSRAVSIGTSTRKPARMRQVPTVPRKRWSKAETLDALTRPSRSAERPFVEGLLAGRCASAFSAVGESWRQDHGCGGLRGPGRGRQISLAGAGSQPPLPFDRCQPYNDHHLQPSSHHLTSCTSPELASICLPEPFER
jgi:hypothetical protein